MGIESGRWCWVESYQDVCDKPLDSRWRTAYSLAMCFLEFLELLQSPQVPRQPLSPMSAIHIPRHKASAKAAIHPEPEYLESIQRPYTNGWSLRPFFPW